MEQAMALAQQKDGSAGIFKSKSKLSFVSYSDCEIVSKVGRLGVSLGNSFDKVASSVKVIKKLEVEQNLTFLGNNIDSLGTNKSKKLVVSSNRFK
jgi:hypothetical protein